MTPLNWGHTLSDVDGVVSLKLPPIKSFLEYVNMVDRWVVECALQYYLSKMVDLSLDK